MDLPVLAPSVHFLWYVLLTVVVLMTVGGVGTWIYLYNNIQNIDFELARKSNNEENSSKKPILMGLRQSLKQGINSIIPRTPSVSATNQRIQKKKRLKVKNGTNWVIINILTNKPDTINWVKRITFFYFEQSWSRVELAKNIEQNG